MELASRTVQQIQELHRTRVTTPEICSITGLSAEIVLQILVNGYGTRKESRLPKEKRGVGRPELDWSSIAEDLGLLLCREPVLTHLWTLDSALNVLARTSGRLVAKSTVLRKLRDLGFSFDDLVSNLTIEESRLDRARELKRIKRGNLYVLREVRSSNFVASEDQLSGLLAVRADNFALCLLRERRHITSQFYKEFLLRLLSYHQGRHVIVLRQMGSAKREEYLSSVTGCYRRLHLV